MIWKNISERSWTLCYSREGERSGRCLTLHRSPQYHHAQPGNREPFLHSTQLPVRRRPWQARGFRRRGEAGDARWFGILRSSGRSPSHSEVRTGDNRGGDKGVGHSRAGWRCVSESETCSHEALSRARKFADVGSGIYRSFTASPNFAATWTYHAVAERHHRDFRRHSVILTSAVCPTDKDGDGHGFGLRSSTSSRSLRLIQIAIISIC